MKLMFVIMSLSLAQLSDIDAKHSTKPYERKVFVSRTCLKGEEKTKNCVECDCNMKRKWECTSKSKCSLIWNKSATREIGNQTSLDKCRVKFIYNICATFYTLASCLRERRPQKKICLKERCDNEFIKTECEWNGTVQTTTKSTKIQGKDRGSTKKPSESRNSTYSTSSFIPMTTLEPEIEDSGDSFSEEEIESDHFRCQPRKTFKLGCNTCWCDSDGEGPKYCTRIACNPKTYKPLNQ